VFRLHPNNVIGIRSFGDQFMCTNLVEACNKYIQKYFVDVARSEEFMSMEQKDLVEILSNDELHVSSEEQVSIQWLCFQVSLCGTVSIVLLFCCSYCS